MAVASVVVTTDPVVDPNPAPPAHVKDGPNGSAQVDPKLVPPAGDKPAGERPAWLPDKFKTVEDFTKSYGELEKKLGEQKPADKPADKPGDKPGVTPEAAKAAGIDMAALNIEFSKNGELSAETLRTLSDKGFDKAAVDSYIAGQTAITEKMTNELAAVAGGKVQLAATLAWANANLSAEDAAGYEAALDTGDLKLAKLALQGVVAQYEAANGKDPALLNGGEGVGNGDVQPFGSNAEMVAAMKDKRYGTDPVYRSKIEARVIATPTRGGRR